MAKRTSTALIKAVDYFRQAIRLDPGFALAYIGQASSFSLQTEGGNLTRKEAYAVAKPLLDKALELDDQSGEAYAALGLISKTNDPQTEVVYRRSLDLSPNYASAHHWYSNFLRDHGHYDEGLKQINTAIELDPLAVVLQANLGTVLMELGRPTAALAQFKKIIEMDADYPPPYWSTGGLYWAHFGQLDEALTWFKQGLERNPNNATITAWVGLLYLDLGDEAEAEHWINMALEIVPDGLFSNWAKEMLLLFQGEARQAKDHAGKVLRQNPGWVLSLADLRNQDLTAGLAVAASTRYEKQFPILFDEANPKLDGSNVDAAIDLSLIMTRLGQSERARLLLDKSLAYAESTSLPRIHWYSIAYGIPQQVQIYALQGKTGKALESLRQAIDSGWRSLWWYWLEHDPNLDSIRDEPEFQIMLEEIKHDMAAQLERVRIKEQQ